MKHMIKQNDPCFEREAQKYTHPIASREFIMQQLKKIGKPVSYEHLCRDLKIETELGHEALKRRLNAMLRAGQIIQNRRASFAISKDMSLIQGRVSTHRDGFGFLIPEDGSDKIFMSPHELRTVIDGDRVLINVSKSQRGKRREGKLVEILERAKEEIVGRYYNEDGLGFIIPSNKNITHELMIPRGQERNAIDGQLVSAKITAFPTFRRQMVGTVLEVLGEDLTPGVEIEVAIRAHDLPHVWPADVQEESHSINKDLGSQKHSKKRIDLTQLHFVTIDGEDAKDFDDAVYCEKQKHGYKLYVAIADVSHFVRADSALDLEAFNRGNSVYFPGRVIPMLPEVLSNELCSLKPQVERFTLVCEMELNSDGDVDKYKFYEATIKSQARLTYTAVYNWLSKKIPLPNTPDNLHRDIENLAELFTILKKQRQKRGALAFNKPETRIIFDENHKIKNIVPVTRNMAHEIIEECMLTANVCASQFLSKSKLPTLYRVHSGPDADKLEKLRLFLLSFGLKIGGGKKPTSLDYAALLDEIAGRNDEYIIQIVLLRSLSQAVYTTKNVGHFALAYAAYTHFTSPIRRYADLIVHRTIKHVLENGNKKNFYYDQDAVQKFCDHTSITERRADDATRDAIERLKCDYLHNRVGDNFSGIISGVTDFGIFVNLQEFDIDGLVHITDLKNDYYRFESAHHKLIGKRSGVCYQLGDKIDVKIASINTDERKIDLILVEED